ncbi:hypothetical protein [Blastococcus brunescens]|uniref:Transcription regulator PadR N-terminal domain-containing protein n=1 Tax=Blastococcus brunescens TaxID=1564165 RepID=A0ABZ1B8L1_9ACTN|nr:hypothetical protein [Blastococcus sp. BMG 8361]WRL67130.1 hypothetical protein U6N30_24000 [Blastococcus sp. BMG 8361]
MHAHPHLDTEALIGAARTRLDAISHQAVYDVLRVLTDTGLVRRIQPQGSVARYRRAWATTTTTWSAATAAPSSTSTAPSERPRASPLRPRGLRRGRGRGRLLGPLPELRGRLTHRPFPHPARGTARSPTPPDTQEGSP